MYSDNEMNAAARPLPYESAKIAGDADALPVIDIHEVQIYAYVKDGRLIVSVHPDGDPDVWGETVPMEINVGGRIVWETSSPHEPSDEELFAVKKDLTGRPVVENDKFAAFARRIVAAHGRRIGRGDVEGLRDLAALSRAADDALRMAVRSLKKDGYSWAEIAKRLDVTRQAAQQRFGAPRLINHEGESS